MIIGFRPSGRSKLIGQLPNRRRLALKTREQPDPSRIRKRTQTPSEELEQRIRRLSYTAWRVEGHAIYCTTRPGPLQRIFP